MATHERPGAIALERRDADMTSGDRDAVHDEHRRAVDVGTGPGLVPAQVLARRTVASYRSYADAVRAIDYLSDRKFPVHRTAIVGEGITFVEQVTGRMGYGHAALNGAVSAAVTGALFGFIFGLFDWITPVLSSLTLALYGLMYGAIVGAVFGLLVHAMSGGRRDFTSASGIRAERYCVGVDQEVANEAAQILQSMR